MICVSLSGEEDKKESKASNVCKSNEGEREGEGEAEGEGEGEGKGEGKGGGGERGEEREGKGEHVNGEGGCRLKAETRDVGGYQQLVRAAMHGLHAFTVCVFEVTLYTATGVEHL